MAALPPGAARALVVLALLLSVASCGADPVARGSKTGERIVVLEIASIDGTNSNGQNPAPEVFLDQLKTLSGGQLRVDFESAFNDGEPTAETDLVSAIVAGEVDVGWPAARAFASAGITSLAVLEAPFTITSLEVEKAIATGEIGERLLTSLSDEGLVGLGLAVGPLRRPFSVHPLVELADWQGTAFRSYSSRTQTATINALSGRAITASFDFPSMVKRGELHGVETDLAQYVANRYGDLLPHVTRNIVLWPKMFVFTMNAGAFARLTDEQQGWVRSAAEAAVRASVEFEYDENGPAAEMCSDGITFHDVPAEAVTTLRQAVEPVLVDLGSDPVSRSLLAEIRRLSSDHPGVDLPQVAADCLG
jgi:TRAP-type C4-dicarboxylate transport system substrate-binding protein